MKAFEAWHERQMNLIQNRFLRWFERHFKPAKAYVWKAALKWVESMFEENLKHYPQGVVYNVPEEIKKELDNE